jgi:peptide/nickel transport system permease protein
MATQSSAVGAIPAGRVAEPRSNPQQGIGWALRALRRDGLALAATVFLLVVVVSALLANQLVQVGLLADPDAQSLALRNTPPGYAPDGSFRPLGTDQLGRDMVTRLVYGARISLSVGAATVAV